MRLTDYISQHGDDHCAILFNVKPRTVASWRRRERHPRTQQAHYIVHITKGVVQWHDIYLPVSAHAKAA